MRVLRLALRDYRGTAEREIEFAPTGVTIAVGPNEVGKSSLAEALELLFDERADTTKQRVREVQPVDRDAGSAVEADVELGPYRFTYAKRFHRRTSTHLALHAPHTETWTGREAHERVRAWLDEHVDTALWRALSIVQGASLVQPGLDEAPSLAAALDRAAGVRGGGESEESLYDAARAACEEHFTPTGRPRRELTALDDAVEQARAEEQRRRDALDALERDVEKEASLRRRLADVDAKIAAGRGALREAELELEAVDARRAEVRQLAALRDTALAEEKVALQAARARGQLAALHATAAHELESLAEAIESEEPAHVAAGAELRHVEEKLEQARRARDLAADGLRRAQHDAALHRDAREREALATRVAQVAHEREEAARAREVLAAPPIDDAAVAAIQKAQVEVERAETRLAAEGPTVQLAPEVDLELVVDGRRERIPAGRAVERRVGEAMLVSLPGVAEITVVAGSGVAELRKRLEQSRTRLRTLCAEAGVDDHADAVAALAKRRAAEAELERSEGRLARVLDGDAPEALEARLHALDERLARRRAERPDGPPAPATLEEAAAALERAERDAAAARACAEDWERRRQQAADRFDALDRQRSDTGTRLELAERNRADLARRLADARSETADEALDERRSACADAARDAEAHAAQAERELAALDPDGLDARVAAQRDALDTAERERRTLHDERVRIGERLEVMGGEGLFERWQGARRARERAERERGARRRRADAARRLFDVLHAERDASRSHYATPLAEEIARLGRPLYGESFAVELDAELRIARRLLDGTALAESQLSAGAREQLALLSRLAAARLAGGVPLWLDDALGHTDPQRLAALGPLLAAAGEHTQVVVLTCSPERFRSVPGARIVELR